MERRTIAGLSRPPRLGGGPALDLGGVQCFPLDGGTLQMEIPLAKVLRLDLVIRPVLVKAWWGTVLLDCGAGDFDPVRWRRYGVQPPRIPLIHQLEGQGVRARDVDLVVLSHLHFDHACGGLAGRKPRFPRADYLLQRSEWEAALAKESVVAERFRRYLPESRLRLLDGDAEVAPGLECLLTPGHSPGMQISRLAGRQREALFLSDLVPVSRSLVLGPDRFSDPEPELALRHRRRVVEEMVERDALALFYHDPHKAVARVGWRRVGESARALY